MTSVGTEYGSNFFGLSSIRHILAKDVAVDKAMTMSALLLAVAASPNHLHDPFPIVTNPPSWGWGTLGAMSFAHTGQAQPYSVTDLALLARYPMVQFDKKELVGTMPTVDAQVTD